MLDLLDLEMHVTVVDQHVVAGLEHLSEDCRQHRDLAVGRLRREDDDGFLVPREPDRLGKIGDADLRALQVGDQGEWPPDLFLRRADLARALGMILRRAVGEVQACGIHARACERHEQLGRGRRRPDRGHDFRASGRDLRHGLSVTAGSGRVARERLPARVDRRAAELLLDPQELVVLRRAIRP